MTSYTVAATDVALVRETKAGKSLWSLQHGPSRTGAQIISVQPRRKGFCLELPVNDTGHIFPLRVQYCLRKKDTNDDGEGAVMPKPAWEARKADFVRSFGRQIRTYMEDVGETNFSLIRFMFRVVSIAQQAADGACWEVHVFNVADAVIDSSDPFGAAKE